MIAENWFSWVETLLGIEIMGWLASSAVGAFPVDEHVLAFIKGFTNIS